MFCPACGTENQDETDIRFCRACGRDLRAVSKAMARSLPLRVAASIDAYFENRFQHNLRNGIVNLVAFVVLLIIGGGYLWHGGWGSGILMLGLAAISITTGIWDIWIYKRNLPRLAKQEREFPNEATQIKFSHDKQAPPRSVTEGTTKHLDKKRAR